MGATPVVAAVAPTPAIVAPVAAAIDLKKAKATYEAVCTQCHELSDIENAPPTTAQDTRDMIERMIRENEAELTVEEITLCAAWLDATYVTKK